MIGSPVGSPVGSPFGSPFSNPVIGGGGVPVYIASIYQGQKTTGTTELSESLATGVTALKVESDAGTGLVTINVDGIEVLTVADGLTDSVLGISGSTVSWSSENTGTIQLGQGVS